MTCFWDGILQALHSPPQPLLRTRYTKVNFINYLKSKNRKVGNILWNTNPISNQEKEEHFKAIQDYDIGKIGGGHLCSTCDSFLLLICEIFNVSIEHNYMGIKINYKKIGANRLLKFGSDRGHFWKR